MKKMLFLLGILLGVASCCPQEDQELCSVTTEYNSSEITVTPSETTVLKGEIVTLNYVVKQGYKLNSVTVNGQQGHPSGGKLMLVTSEDSHVSFYTERVVEYSTVNVTCGVGGVVSPSGLNTVEKGKNLYINVVANQGYFIDSVYFDGVGSKVAKFTSEYYKQYTSVDTMNHTFYATFVAKKKYHIIVQPDSLTTCNYSGSYEVTEGGSMTIRWSAEQFCSITSQKVDGVTVTGSSVTFDKVDADHVVVITAKKEPEWYLVKIKWKLAYLNIGGTEYVPYNEVFDFLPDGTYKSYFTDGINYEVLNWYKNGSIITFQVNGIITIATVDKIDDKVLLFHYTTQTGSKIIEGFENIGYQ